VKKLKFKKILSTLTVSSTILFTMATPTLAATGDLYDTTTMIHYPIQNLSQTDKSNIVSAYAKGDNFVKEQSNGKFLDYNSAYAEFAAKIASGSSVSDAILAVASDTSLQTTIDTSKFTDGTNPFLVAPKSNIIDIEGTLDLTKATSVKGTGQTSNTIVNGVVDTTSGAFTIDISPFGIEQVNVQAYDAYGNMVGSPVSVVVMGSGTGTGIGISNQNVNPFIVPLKFNVFNIDGTLDLTKATVVKATGTEGTVTGVVNPSTGVFIISTATFSTEAVKVQAYDANGNAVGSPVSVVVM
jgi:hypothetical protein